MRPPVRGFRDQLIAAPLKLGRLRKKRQPVISFPRSIDRGPIEASSDLSVSIAGSRPFPRSIDRGPIEALWFPWSLSVHNSCFRDQLIAAPLKRCRHCNIADSKTRFRDQLIAAPLKLYIQSSERSNLFLFPRSIDRGPIEAAGCPERCASLMAFPRSIDRGPIEAFGTDPVTNDYGSGFPRSIDRVLSASVRRVIGGQIGFH